MIVTEKVRTRLAATTRFGVVHEWASIDSTNVWLLGEAQAGAPEGVVALADHQTAGRGRLGRVWEAPAGTALLVSVLLRPVGLEPSRMHLVSAAVGLSAREACSDVAGFAPGLKWPNDLLVGDGKLGGILAEVDRGAVIVGLGLNVSAAPPGAASAEQAAGRPVDRAELLVGFLLALEGWYGRWDDISQAYREASATVGRRVRVELAGGALVGTAEDIDGAGRLLVRSDEDALVAVTAGDVIHLRPDPGGESGAREAGGAGKYSWAQ